MTQEEHQKSHASLLIIVRSPWVKRVPQPEHGSSYSTRMIQVGFTIGEIVGPRFGRNPDAKIIKPEYIERTHAFFDRHGPKTIVLARFVPIVRTFAPVVAGVAHMRRSAFLRYNLVGAGLWVAVATLLGYFLADLIGDSIDTYILPIIGLIVIISLVPPLLEWRRHRNSTPRDDAPDL